MRRIGMKVMKDIDKALKSSGKVVLWDLYNALTSSVIYFTKLTFGNIAFNRDVYNYLFAVF